jgi:hypothetical protein
VGVAKKFKHEDAKIAKFTKNFKEEEGVAGGEMLLGRRGCGGKVMKAMKKR